MVIVETKLFTARAIELLSDDEYRALQLELSRQPALGAVIPRTGGLRKLRWRLPGRGKRGGARVIYFWHVETSRILMLFIYAKSERSDLTATQREALRKVIEREYP